MSRLTLNLVYVFLILKCRGESDLGLYTASEHAKRMPLRGGNFRRFLRPNMFLNRKAPPRSGILFASPEAVHRPRSSLPLHFHITNIQQIHMEKYNADSRFLLRSALLECWPHVSSVYITFGYYQSIGSLQANSMKCLVNWIPRSFEKKTQPHLENF